MQYPPTKTDPWSHQVEAWQIGQHQDAFYLAMDMGTGKTKTAIDFCNGFGVTKVLVICPKKVIPAWPRQFDIHSATPIRVIAPTQSSMTVKKKAGLIKHELEMNQSQPICFVLNYEAFWRSPLGPTFRQQGPRKKQIMIDKGVLLNTIWDLVIFDEAHRLKAPGGQASWGAMRLCKQAKRKLFLSGTPMPSNPMDVYAQYRALNPHIFGTSLNRFKKRYFIVGEYEEFVAMNPAKEAEFTNKLYSCMYRVNADDVLDLPDVIHEPLYCEMSPKAQRTYQKLESDFVAQVDNGQVTVNNALTKLLRLAQMAGGHATLDDDAGISEIDTSKLDTLVEKIEDLPADEKVVIFYRFTPEAKRIKEELTKKGRTVGEISGQMNDEPGWINGDFNTICVQIQAGGEGLDTLKTARYGFFYSKGMLSAGKYDQAIRRLVRPGQTRKVIFYHVIAKKTIDERIEIALKKKGNIIANVLNDMKTQDPFGKAA